MELLHYASFGIGVLGVLVIVFGVAAGLARFLRAEILSVRGKDVENERKSLRHVLGYYLLLGLEFLIAAGIIDTLKKPSVQDLIVPFPPAATALHRGEPDRRRGNNGTMIATAFLILLGTYLACG